MVHYCTSCSYGGLVCGRGLQVHQGDYRSCIRFTPGGSSRKRVGINFREYLRNHPRNMLDQAPKFSFEIEEYKVLCRRWIYKDRYNRKTKWIKYYYFIRIRRYNNVNYLLILDEISKKYPGYYVTNLGLIIYIMSPSLSKATQAKIKHTRNKTNVSL